MNPRLLRLSFAFAALLSASPAFAGELQLAGIFGEHMVLLRDRPVPVWGRAQPGADVTVEIAERSSHARAEGDGRFTLELPAHPAGGPFELRVRAGTEELVLRDVRFGEVWLCSGQSNMQFPLGAAVGGPDEVGALAALEIGLYVVPARGGDGGDVAGAWRRAGAEDGGELSAVAYFFARDLRRTLDVPIGIVQAAVGGTPAEAWTELEALRANEALAPSLARPSRKELGKPGALFAGMIAPLAPFSFRGVLWYQGESNASLAAQYRILFPTLVRSWRRAFRRDDLPFLFVELPGFGVPTEEPVESEWAELREAQEQALALPNVGRVVTLDVGDVDLHPPRKREVGERLARLARARVYDHEAGDLFPVFAGLRVEGSSAVVTFANARGGLRLAEGEQPYGFTIAGADGRFVRAQATLDGERVVVRSPEVAAPVSVRYAWADRPRVNLVNADGLPAAPFRASATR